MNAMNIINHYHIPAAISPDGSLVQCREQRAWHGCRSTRGVREGKVYYEAIVTDEGLCRVGWATADGSLELGETSLAGVHVL